MHMDQLGILYLYELKKIIKRRLVRITFLICPPLQCRLQHHTHVDQWQRLRCHRLGTGGKRTLLRQNRFTGRRLERYNTLPNSFSPLGLTVLLFVTLPGLL